MILFSEQKSKNHDWFSKIVSVINGFRFVNLGFENKFCSFPRKIKTIETKNTFHNCRIFEKLYWTILYTIGWNFNRIKYISCIQNRKIKIILKVQNSQKSSRKSRTIQESPGASQTCPSQKSISVKNDFKFKFQSLWVNEKFIRIGFNWRRECQKQRRPAFSLFTFR